MAETKIPWTCPQCGRERLVVPCKLKKSTTGGMCRPCFARTLNIRHGKCRTRIYQIWAGMINRCLNPNSKSYRDYGGRGITVCDRWQSFDNFLVDMGEPAPTLSIERRDNNGNYCPANCFWATSKEQCNNKRGNHLITYNGETGTMKQMAAKHGINYSTLRSRINRSHWAPERALAEAIEAQSCG